MTDTNKLAQVTPAPSPPDLARDHYGCVQCQTYHYRGDPLFEAHVWRQDKHGIRHVIPAAPSPEPQERMTDQALRDRRILARSCAAALRAHAETYRGDLPEAVRLRLQMSADVLDEFAKAPEAPSAPVEPEREHVPWFTCQKCRQFVIGAHVCGGYTITSTPPQEPAPTCEGGDCNPFIAACGARFCTYEEMHQHNKLHAESPQEPAHGEGHDRHARGHHGAGEGEQGVAAEGRPARPADSRGTSGDCAPQPEQGVAGDRRADQVEVATPSTGRGRIIAKAGAVGIKPGRMFPDIDAMVDTAAREALTILEERYNDYSADRRLTRFIADLKAELSDGETP